MNQSSQPYQYQNSLHRKTRNALVTTTLALISEKGLSACNMIEIADQARVSRASLYNHFRDKNDVFLAVIDFEIERISILASRGNELSEKLYIFSKEISANQALGKSLALDPALLTKAISAREHELWAKIYQTLTFHISSDVAGVALVLRWLVGQIFLPLSLEHSKEQAARLARELSR